MRKKISVVMAVYNTKKEYLVEAIESILKQTHENFEFIIINDNSERETVQILQSFTDNRIRIIHNEKNLGLTKSLNIGFSQSTGEYIARMDSDDISLPRRLEYQYKFMETHKDSIVVGAFTRDLDTKKNLYQHWTDNQELLKIRLLFYNAGIAHPTAFFRRELLKRYELDYDETILKSQDYAMWVNIAQKGKLKIVPKVLLEYRSHHDQISQAQGSEQNHFEKVIMERQLLRFSKNFSEKEKKVFFGFNRGNLEYGVIDANQLINQLIEANKIDKIYEDKLFNDELIRLWLISSIKRIIKIKKFDMILSEFSLKVFNPRVLLHFFNYLVFQNGKVYIWNNRNECK